jgi:hypothetical protein
MSVRTPGTQPRSQYHSYWGRYTFGSFALPPAYLGRSPDLGSQNLPNSSGNILSASEYAKLEAGDIAATQPLSPIGPPLGFEFGLFTCIYPGTLGGGDAVWVRCDNLAAGSSTIRDAHVIVVAQQGTFNLTSGSPVTDTLLNINPQVAGVAADFVDIGDGAELANALAAAAAIGLVPNSSPVDVRLRPCNINLELPGSPATPLVIPPSTRLVGASDRTSLIFGKFTALGIDQRVFSCQANSSLEKLGIESTAPLAAPVNAGGIINVVGTGVDISDVAVILGINPAVARTTLACIDTTTIALGSRLNVTNCRFTATSISHQVNHATDSVGIRTQGTSVAGQLGTLIQGCTFESFDVGIAIGPVGTNGGDVAASTVSMINMFRAGVSMSAGNNLEGSGYRFSDIRCSMALSFAPLPAQPQQMFEIRVTGVAARLNQISISGCSVRFAALSTVADRNFARIIGSGNCLGANGIKVVGCGVEQTSSTTSPATDAIVLSNATPDDNIRGGDILCDWQNVSGVVVSVIAGAPTWEHAHSV